MENLIRDWQERITLTCVISNGLHRIDEGAKEITIP